MIGIMWRTAWLMLLVNLASCSEGTPGGAKGRIADALTAVKEMRRMIPDDSGLALTESILANANYEGPLREWGCLAVFDRSGKMTSAYTLKVKDFHTGRSFPIRKYTIQELEQSRPQVAAYKRLAGIKNHYSIPIVSESFKLAVAEMVLHTDSRVQYTIGRGVRDLEISRLKAGITTVVAADALYVTSADLENLGSASSKAGALEDRLQEIERLTQNLLPGGVIVVGSDKEGEKLMQRIIERSKAAGHETWERNERGELD